LKVLFISPVPEEGASYRYRVKQYIPFLESHGIYCTESPFISPDFFRIVYRSGRFGLKVLYFIKSSWQRFVDGSTIKKHDIVFIHRESFPIGPPIFETFVKLIGKPIIYDFDDAIYLRSPYSSSGLNKFAFLKFCGNVPKIIKKSNHVIVCNNHLKKFAHQFNSRVSIIPTSVDTEKFIFQDKDRISKRLTIGWIGSYTTSAYLELLRRVFQGLAKKYDFVLKIVGAGRKIEFPGVTIENLDWNLSSEIADFQSLDIGIYPLPNDNWALGKTGFKTVQYMSVGIPCVCSNVGRNKEIIQDGVNGFLANSDEEWIHKLSWLIENPTLRDEFGKQARQTAEERFSLKVNAPKLLETLENVYYASKKSG